MYYKKIKNTYLSLVAQQHIRARAMVAAALGRKGRHSGMHLVLLL